MDSRKSVGSILKPAKVRAPLKQIEVVDQDDDENTATSIKRKVSFSGMNKIKMFNTGATSLTVHQAPMFDEQISVLSDTSNTEKPVLSEKFEKSDGQMTFESTNCTNVENNPRVIIEYESPNDNMEMTEALSGKLFTDTIYTIDDNGSEYIDYKSDYSDSNMEITEAIHVGQVITTDDIESDFSSTEMSQALNDKKNELETSFEDVSNSEQLETQWVYINDDENSIKLMNDSQQSKEIVELNNVEYSNKEAKELINSLHDSVYKSSSLPNKKIPLLSVSSDAEKTKLLGEFKQFEDQITVETSICPNLEDDVHIITEYECSYNMEMTEVLSGKIVSDEMYTITDNESIEQINYSSNFNNYSDSNMEITKTLEVNQDIKCDISYSETSEILNDENEDLKVEFKEISNLLINNDNSLSLMNVKSLAQELDISPLDISNTSLINKIHSNHDDNEISTNKINDNVSSSLVPNNSTIQKLNESGELLNNKRQKANENNENNIKSVYKYTKSLSKRKMSISGMNKIKTYNISATPIAGIHELSMLDEKNSLLFDSTNNEKIKLSGEYEKFDNQINAKSADYTQEDNNIECLKSNHDIKITETVTGKILSSPIYNIDNNYSQQNYKCIDNNSDIEIELSETIQVGKIIPVDNESDITSTEMFITLNDENEQLEIQSKETSNSSVNIDANSISVNKLNESGQSLINEKYFYKEVNAINTNITYDKELSLMDIDSPIKKFNETDKSLRSNEIEKEKLTEIIQVGNIVTVDNESDLSSTEMSKTLNNEDGQLDIQSKVTYYSSFNSDVNSISIKKECGQSLINENYFYQEVNTINTNEYDKEVSLMDVDSPTKIFNISRKPLRSNEIEEEEFTETIQVGKIITIGNKSDLRSIKMSKILSDEDEQLGTQSREISKTLVNNDRNLLSFDQLNESDKSLNNEIHISQEVNEHKTNNGYNCVNKMAKEKFIIIPDNLEQNKKPIDNKIHENEMLKDRGEKGINKDSIEINDTGNIISSKDYSSECSLNKITNDIFIEDVSNMSISDKTKQNDEKSFIGNRKRSYSNRNYAPLSCSSFISNSQIQNNAIGESPIRKKFTKEDSINKEYAEVNVVHTNLLEKEQPDEEYLCNEVLEFLTRWNGKFVENKLILNKCTNSEWIFYILDNNIILTILYSPIFNDNSFLKVDDISFKTHNITQNNSINFGINWILSKYNSKVYKQICFTSRDVELVLKSLLDDVEFISKVINNILFIKDVYCVTVKDDKAQFILHDMNDKNGPLMVHIEVSLINIHKLSVKHITADVLFGVFNTNIINEIMENVTKDCNVLQSLIENLKKYFKNVE